MTEHRGGSGNFAEDREKASNAGRKAVSIAAVILKMIRNAHPKQVKKAVNKAVIINQENPDSPLIINIS